MQEAGLTTVIVPFYNEERTIGKMLERLFAQPFQKQVIVVDDGSTDAGAKEVARFPVERIRLESNSGKGHAIRAALAQAKGEVVVIQDADLEYDPVEIPRLTKLIFEDRADAVYGSRFTGHPRRSLFYWHHLANNVITMLSNLLSDLDLTDMETGAKAFRAETLKKITLTSNRFGFEPEVTAKLSKMKARIFEIDYPYFGRTYEEGKKIDFLDALAAFWHVLRFNLGN